MSKMFVANASIQNHIFMYRIPEVEKTRQIPIPQNTQIRLPDDLNKEQIDAIVSQHEKYGFASVADIKAGNIKRKFTRLCYSIDVPVSALMIEALLRSNVQVLDDSGRELRKQTAIVANEAVIRELEKQKRENGLNADIHDFEQTIQEVEPVSGYDRPMSDIIGEGYRVTDTAAVSKTRRRR